MRFMPAKSLTVVVIGCICLEPLIRAEQIPLFQTRTELVTVPVTVKDNDGHFADGLTTNDIDVYEDDVVRPIVQFSREVVPISVAIMLDISGSMQRKSSRPRVDTRWKDTLLAVNTFLSRLRPEDEVSLSVFNQRPNLLMDWTYDRQAVRRALDGVELGGGTSVFRALIAAVGSLGGARSRRQVVLLISDGIDNDVPNQFLDSSAYDVGMFRYQQRLRAQAALQKTEATLYAFGMATRGDAFPVNLVTLRPMATTTGGYAEAITQPDAITKTIIDLSDDLRAQYMLGFVPANARDGKFHSIKVKAHDSQYRIRAKPGYIASP
jgi:Ca-activated chloride channel family protein